MKDRIFRRLTPAWTLTIIICLFAPAAAADREERLWHFRNLGKAYYENQLTQDQAVGVFEKALALAPDSPRELINYGLALLLVNRSDEGVEQLKKAQRLDPTIPHTWFNLGILYKNQAQYSLALEQFERMVQLDPEEPISQYNLGVLYKLTGRADEAIERFEAAIELDHNLAGPHFQLYTSYRSKGRQEDAQRALETFRELKGRQEGAPIPEDLDWSIYSEILDEVEPLEPKDPPIQVQFQIRVLKRGVEGERSGILTLDVNGDMNPDLLVWTSNGIEIFSRGAESLPATGLENVRDVVAVSAADFNNDGLVDLCIVAAGGATLYENRGGKFEKAKFSLPDGSFAGAVWLDFDHDNDPDLFLLGERSFLMRNDGEAGFSNISSRFPFQPGRAVSAVAFDRAKDTNSVDLLVAYEDREGVLYRDRLGGRYEPIPQPQVPRMAESLTVGDLNNDGWTDLVATGPEGVFWIANNRGELEPRPVGAASQAALLIADFDNRGIPHLAAGAELMSNLGRGRFSARQTLPEVGSVRALGAADLNRNGKMDLIALSGNGDLVVLENTTRSPYNWISISLQGVRNPKLAPLAEVEVKAGALYQKKIYSGTPLHFGLGSREKIDTVRITWSNGLIQNEAEQDPNQILVLEERQRLSGSCPTVFTWNGQEFEFITDILGVAPLGVPAGNDEYLQVQNEEYIWIPAEALSARNGLFEVRLTEELREVAYLDQVRLLAVDHPIGMDVFTNDKFKAPPFPDFRLFGVTKRIDPTSATDQGGRDLLQKVGARNRQYADAFERDYAGVAEFHHVELDFGRNAASDNRAILVLHGWVDWPDGSTMLRRAQTGQPFVLPYLQVLNEAGQWETVIQDMGIPAGKPKTIVVDLSRKFLSAERKVRIVTNLALYWDEIFLSEETAPPPAVLREIPLQSADLQLRGFSALLMHPERKQPEWFDYALWTSDAMWDPIPGNYTRFGPVEELLESVDDRMVIMGAGDELRLLFDGDGLPPIKKGMQRNFLFYANGWVKDGDLNTGFSQTVEPLPYQRMSSYPYPEDESYPDTPEHRTYRETYNIRPALQLMRSLCGRCDKGRMDSAAEDD